MTGPKKDRIKEISRNLQLDEARRQDQAEREAFPLMTGETTGQQMERVLRKQFEWEDKIDGLGDHDD